MNTVNFPHRSEPGTTVSSQVLSNDAPANASPFTPAAPSPATTTDKAGQGMVTLKDVANRAGVSLSTAGAALRGESIVKTTTKELILQAARELGYSTNLPARYLKKGRTGAIAVMIPHILQPYYARLAYAIDAEASRHGLRTIIQQTGYTSMSEESALHRINSMPCDGLILNMSNVDADHLHTMIGNHPTVLLNYHADPPLFDNVASPIASSATTAFGYLRGRGYRRVAIIGGQRIDRFEPDLQAQKTHTHYVMQALESTGLGSRRFRVLQLERRRRIGRRARAVHAGRRVGGPAWNRRRRRYRHPYRRPPTRRRYGPDRGGRYHAAPRGTARRPLRRLLLHERPDRLRPDSRAARRRHPCARR